MSLVFPNVGTRKVLDLILAANLTLKLYSNNQTPGLGDTAANYTSVVGGGYAAVTLPFANWIISTDNPSLAVYNTYIEFQFTGPTNAPGTIYGYYIVDAANILRSMERFPSGEVPFTPINGSLIKIKPKITVASAFSS